jgi:hypothetical protein
MGVVHREDFFEQALSASTLAKPEVRLSFKVARIDGLKPGKIFIEEKHGR